MATRLIYLLLFIAPQALIYLYLRERLPDPTRPRQARLVRAGLAAVFLVFNLPWLAVAHRILFDSVWGVSWYTGSSRPASRNRCSQRVSPEHQPAR